MIHLHAVLSFKIDQSLLFNRTPIRNTHESHIFDDLMLGDWNWIDAKMATIATYRKTRQYVAQEMEGN